MARQEPRHVASGVDPYPPTARKRGRVWRASNGPGAWFRCQIGAKRLGGSLVFQEVGNCGHDANRLVYLLFWAVIGDFDRRLDLEDPLIGSLNIANLGA